MRYKRGNLIRNQISIDPLSIDQRISEDNPIRVIDEFVEMLDIKDLGCTYSEPKKTGQKPYNPKDMLKLYIYGYFNGIRTSRKLETECNRNIELMWLMHGLAPDFKTIADFRKDNKPVVIGMFKEFSILCNELNLIGKEIVAIDGSKFRASNSRHKNYTKRKVEKMIKHHEESAQKYIDLLESSDKVDTESKTFDSNVLKEKLAKSKKRIEELKVLKVEIEENGEVSITDPDARHMSVSNNGTDISHNVQTAVDSKHHLVVAVDVISKAADNGQLYPMATKVKKELGIEEITVLADKGYYNGECLKNCEENGITTIVSKPKIGSSTGDDNYSKDKFKYDKEKDIFICPEGKVLEKFTRENSITQRYRCLDYADCPNKDKCTKSEKGRSITFGEYQEYYNRADERFKENIELYKQRQMLVEHPFGTIKRGLGYTYFLLRGNESVQCESHMHFLIYNLKRVINIVGISPLIEAIRERKGTKHSFISDYFTKNFVCIFGFRKIILKEI